MGWLAKSAFKLVRSFFYHRCYLNLPPFQAEDSYSKKDLGFSSNDGQIDVYLYTSS